MMNGMYGGAPHANGLAHHHPRPPPEAEPPAKRYKPAQAQAVMQGNHGTSLVEAINALEIQSHLDTLLVRAVFLPPGLIPFSSVFSHCARAGGSAAKASATRSMSSRPPHGYHPVNVIL